MALSVTSTFSPCPVAVASFSVSSRSVGLRDSSACCLSLSCQAMKLHAASNPCQEVDSNFKVFSDDKTGVVCYKNELGEIVCEGPDEGPHFYPHPHLSSESSIYVPGDQAAAILPIFGELIYEI